MDTLESDYEDACNERWRLLRLWEGAHLIERRAKLALELQDAECLRIFEEIQKAKAAN